MNELYLVPQIAPGVISRIIEATINSEQEALIMLPLQGQVKVVNETGALIWSCIDGQRNVVQIATLLHQAYQVQIEQAQTDVLEFLRDLESRNILSLQTPST